MERWERPHSLRARIIVWSFVPAALILLAVAGVNLLSYQRVTEDLVVERDRELTRLMAVQLSAELTHYADLLGDVARQPAVCSADPAPATALTAAAERLRVFDAGVMVLDADGRVVACQPQRDGDLGRSWAGRDYFQTVRDTGGPAYSDIVVDGPEGAEVIVAAVPVADYDGTFRGALVGMFRLGAVTVQDLSATESAEVLRGNVPRDASYVAGTSSGSPDGVVLAGLYRLFQQQPRLVSANVSGRGSAYLVDGDGRIIYHADTMRIGDRLPTQVAVQEVRGRRTGALHTVDLYGQEIVASYAPVPGTSWGLVVEESWANLIGASSTYRDVMLGLLAVGLAIPAAVVVLTSRRITRPLRELTEAARRVAAGDLQQHLAPPADAELRALAEQFNAMSAQLQGSYAHLERRVAERTAQLSALNEITAQLGRSLDLADVFAVALTRTLALLDLPAGVLLHWPAADCPPQAAAQRGVAAEAAERLAADLAALAPGEIGPAPGLWRREQGATPPPALAPAAAALAAWPWRTLVGVPLVAREQALGLLVLGAPDDRPFSDETLALLASIGRQVGGAVENALLYRQAQGAAALAERQRLARDLHDSVTQSLYAALLYAKAADRLLAAGDAAQAADYIGALQASAQDALQEMRQLIFELRPAVLDEEGLSAALQARLDAVETRAGLSARLETDGDLRLPPAVAEGLYRIAQEALNNVLRHARARHVAVTLRRAGDELILQVADDGQGCHPESAAGGLGWRGMRERADALGARLAIVGEPGRGTTVRVEMRVAGLS